MEYNNIVKGRFIDRPNRFIANCEINGKTEVCHVKNTGRCKELLIQGTTVYLQKSDNPNRKTQYDLIAVQKGERLINMDSQIVNSVALEYVPRLFDKIKFIKPDYTSGNSRFDIYIETETDKRTHTYGYVWALVHSVSMAITYTRYVQIIMRNYANASEC